MTLSAAEMETGTKSEAKPARKCNTKLWGGLAVISMIGGTVGGVMGGIYGNPARNVKGTYKTNFGSYVTITDNSWYTGSSWGNGVSSVIKFTGSYVITQNSATDAYNPSKFVKNEYHAATPPAKHAYCSSKYDAATLAEAESFDTSAIYDKTNAATGCNGFGFTELTPYSNPLIGSFNTNYNQKIVITATEWQVDGKTPSKIEAFGDGWVLMQNPADAEYNPSQWSFVQWHKEGTGWAYCTSIYNGASAKAAFTADTSKIYDKANSAKGCNGFPFTISTPA